MLKTVGNPSTRFGDQTILNGNLVIGTAGNGIDFSATAGTGTSELLDDYEEGTWSSASITGANCSAVSLSNATYTKIGRLVTITGRFSATLTTTATAVYIVFLVPFPTVPNLCSSVGPVYHNLLVGSDGIGIVADWSPAQATQTGILIPAAQVTAINGSAFTADFSFQYEAST
jgi:hypothetical protein